MAGSPSPPTVTLRRSQTQAGTRTKKQRIRTGRILTAGAVAAITAGSVTLSAAPQAEAAPPAAPSASRTRTTASPVSHRAHMGSYGASRFAAAAAKLPAGVAVQLRTQLGITPEQFLADGQAAADAGRVITSLRAGGVNVVGARLNGTTVTVTVPDAAGAATAEADGAKAVIGSAQPVKTVSATAVSNPADGSSHLLGGDIWVYYTNVSTGAGLTCSTGFNGYAKATGAREFLTAGHCADYRDSGEPAPANGVVYAATDMAPVTLGTTVQIAHPAIGSLIQSSFHFGGGEDAVVVAVTDTEARPEAAVSTWGSRDTTAGAYSTASQGAENSGGTVPILAAAPAVTGEPVCHSGWRTGWQCGIVSSAYVRTDVGGAKVQVVDGMQTSVCLLPGDSGGSFVSGEYAVGTATASSFTPKSGSGAGYSTCSSTGYSIAYPTVAAATGEESAAQSEPGFEFAVAVPTPAVTAATANVVTGNGTISGDLRGPFATGTPVSLSLDGRATASAAADSSGGWSFSLTGLADGAHPFVVTAGSGHTTAATSGTLSIGQVTVAGTVQVGKTLTAGVSGVPSDGTVTYQWNQNGTAVHAGQTYLIPPGGAGQRLTVTATVAEGGNSVSVTSGPAVIALGSLTVVTAPAISGTVKVGATVVASPGTWSVTAPTFTYQWLDNGRPVSGAASASDTIPASLAGQQLSVTVTAHVSGYQTAARASVAHTVAKGNFSVPVRPTLSGTPKVGQTLAVTKGTWNPSPAISIQWYANGKPVARATGTSLKLTAALVGTTMSVAVTGTKAGYVTAAQKLTEGARVQAG